MPAVRLFFTGILALLLLVPITWATQPKDIGKLQSEIQHVFRGKQLILRVPYEAKSVGFDQDVQCVSGCDRGGWAADGTIEFEKFRLRNDGFQISGKRLTIYYDLNNQRMAIPAGTFNISVALPDGVSEDKVNKALNALFRHLGEPVPNGPLPQSQPVDFECKKDPSAGPGSDQQVCRSNGSEGPWIERSKLQVPITIGPGPDGQQVYVVSKAMKPPHALKTPDPEYSERDRRNRLQGGTRFAVLVDSHGRVQSLREEQADFPGFAIDSAKAIATWVFDPATVNGNAVSVLIEVETNFRLY